MQGLEGKTAIVTGGSSGIGQAIAIRLGHEGVNVAVNYVGPMEGAQATKETIDSGVQACIDEVNGCSMPSRAMLVEADVSDEDAVERMFKEVRAELGPVDFLVNNAGIQIAQDSDMLDSAAFDRVLSVNLRGAFLCAKAQIRQLLDDERPGALVNISSVHQVIPKPKFLGYSVSKGGMQNLTRTLALEFAAGHPRQRRWAWRHRDADQSGMDRRPREVGARHQPYPDGARRSRRGDGRHGRVPAVR